jgi:ferredoxin
MTDVFLINDKKGIFMPLVYFEREGRTLNINAGRNLRKLAKQNGVQIYRGIYKLFNCHGFGLCHSCLVEIYPKRDGDLNPRTATEEKRLKVYTNPNLRLACQVRIHGNVRVKTQPVELMAVEKDVVPPPLVS